MKGIQKYLSGQSFSDDLPYRPEIIWHREPRGDLLEMWVAGRAVLHVGFADHAPLIASRVSAGDWLHARLTRAARVCHGIDINAEAVEIAQGLGFLNVSALDIFSASLPELLRELAVDLVLVPDVIEHLPDPAAFLRRLASCLPQTEFVVTVPNALSLRNGVCAAGGLERINTDHRSWFSPFTLSKVLFDAGLVVESLHGCSVVRPGSIKGRALQKLTSKRPIWSDVLLARARLAT